MYKFVVFSALLAVAAAGVISPLVSVHSVPVAHAVSHSSSVVNHGSHLVHAAPVVHSVHAAPLVHSVHAAPVVHSVHAGPVLHAAPLSHSISHSSSVVNHGTPLVKVAPIHAVHAAPIHAVHAAPIVHSVHAAPLVHAHAVPVSHSNSVVHHGSHFVHGTPVLSLHH
ncbi:uncharacterized protein LOC143911719 [Arctopsyche grandis]|uniref:uncharacterized protein LOC143911719 n=1 Tax=Arctopsyche grandis TaxID=121162 RepID=UPI00406D9C7C